MKTIYALILSMSVFYFGNAQTYNSDFEDDTLQEWTDVGASTTGMSVQGEPGYKYLQKVCDGTSTAVGSMAIVNDFNFNGDYTCNDPQGINCFGDYEVLTRNTNAFDLHLRIGFLGENGTLVASQDAVIVPANSDWTFINFYPYNTDLSVVSGTGTVEETMVDVQQMRIFHNENFTFDGAFVTGNLEIDHVFLYILLGTEEFQLDTTSLYPNPTSDVLNVTLPQPVTSNIGIYNLLGQQVLIKTASTKNVAIPVSELKSGVYLVRIEVAGHVLTKKFVKR